MSKTFQHYEESALIPVFAAELFAYIDDHSRFSSHMSRPSWMMGGGRMHIETDQGRGQAVGSHIRLSGKVLGMNLFLDEVVTHRDVPRRKAWETVGVVRLLVVGSYRMGLEIADEGGSSRLKVFIDYEFPEGLGARWLGYLFGKIYAKWCVRRMMRGAMEEFKK